GAGLLPSCTYPGCPAAPVLPPAAVLLRWVHRRIPEYFLAHPSAPAWWWCFRNPDPDKPTPLPLSAEHGPAPAFWRDAPQKPSVLPLTQKTDPLSALRLQKYGYPPAPASPGASRRKSPPPRRVFPTEIRQLHR